MQSLDRIFHPTYASFLYINPMPLALFLKLVTKAAAVSCQFFFYPNSNFCFKKLEIIQLNFRSSTFIPVITDMMNRVLILNFLIGFLNTASFFKQRLCLFCWITSCILNVSER